MGGGNLLFIIMFTLPFVAIAGIIMLARNWSTPVDHPEPSGWEAASKEKKKAGDPLYGPSSSGKKSGTDSGSGTPSTSDAPRPGPDPGPGPGHSGPSGRNGTSPSANGELRARPAIPPQTPAYLDDGDGWLPMDDPANADTGPNPRHRLN